MKNFTVREFTRIGLTREAERDFRDDGTAFKCWSYKGLRISYTKSDDNYYIAVRIDWNNYSFTVQDALKESWYALADEFNRCKNPDADKLLENLEVIYKGAEDLEKRISSEKINVMDLYKAYSNDIANAVDAMEKFRNEFDWIHANEWDRRSSTNAYKKLENLINEDAPNYKKMSLREQRQLLEIVRSNGYVHQELHYLTNSLTSVLN